MTPSAWACSKNVRRDSERHMELGAELKKARVLARELADALRVEVVEVA